MARTIGVDPGDALVKVVELDGSYKKPRLLAVHAAPVDESLPKAGILATAVRGALDGGMKGEVRLGHPCAKAVLRTIDLPFKGKDAIRKVIKAEVEGEIHGYSIDDMVVDFLEVEGAPAGGTRVLVAAAHKDDVRANLMALEAARISPETVDLDTMALWRAADWAGAFDGDGQHGTTAVVDIGSRSVKVLLVQGRDLVDMRVLRLGEYAVADEIAAKHGLAIQDAVRAVTSCAQSGMPFEVKVAPALPARTDGEPVGEDDEPAAADAALPARVEVVQPNEVAAARVAFLQRLRRELIRYLTSSGRGDVGAVWVTGSGSRMPGIEEVLAEAFGTTPLTLDLLGRMQHDLDEEQVVELGPRLATAIGLALAPMGGPTGFDLRREDLADTRGFEKIKFPLTITLMVGLLALFVYGNSLQAKLTLLDYRLGATAKDEQGKTKFRGQAYSATVNESWWKENYRIGRDKFSDLQQELDQLPVYDRVRLLRDRLRAVARQKQKESGIYEDISLESGYAVLVRFAELMTATEDSLGRYLLTKLSLSMKPKARKLEFTVAFRESGFRTRFANLERALQAEYQRPDSPFEPPGGGKSNYKVNIFSDTKETGVEGAYYTITLDIKETFAAFGQGGQR